MNTLSHLGLELPPTPTWTDSSASRHDQIEAVAIQAERAGFSTLWLGDDAESDATTELAALVYPTSTLGLGVICDLSRGRHPAAVARDVTALDVVSAGRAALLLRWGGAGSDAPSSGLQPLVEAAVIARQMFQNGVSTFAGATFTTRGAVNRPRPLAKPGCPVVIDLDLSRAPREEARALAGVADAICVRGGPDDVAAVQASVAGLCPVIWRNAAHDDPRPHVATALHAGASGVLCVVVGQPHVASVEALGHALSPLLPRVPA